MANRTGKSSGARAKGRGGGRGRSRKRRPEPGAAQVNGVDGATGAGAATGERGAARNAVQTGTEKRRAGTASRAGARSQTGFRGALAGAERPRAPWHPWPLSELLILIGAVGAVVGLERAGSGGFAHGGPVLLVGLGAVVLGTLEITWREHRSGYRSHATLLALLVVVVFHTAVVLVAAAFGPVPRALNIGLLAVDVALFAVLFRLLRARYADARARAGLSRR
jgi:hypothetical protein